jgi:aspartyl-tRNA(Asn)/glutamyl-tRNA(Gln) amidotransferase subunit B
MSGYEPVIGLEVHAQLLTKSKMFCGCNADYAGAEPNTHVCPICLGMPGVLPVINRKAVEYTITTALALNCAIAEYTKFDRKNYPYPDLMKGYQISQYDLPLSRNGYLTIERDGERKRIGITRVHLEEDTAKLSHETAPNGETFSLIDVNRSGVPLMEIVGEPDLRSADEAEAYLIKLRNLLRWIGVSSGDLELGGFRCDANVSIRPAGSEAFGTKVEIKNMNSFRAVREALTYEIARQERALEAGERIAQETRGWNEELRATVSQRSKEFAHDYRYFPEPDLPPLVPEPAWVETIRAGLPEMPDARRERFQARFGLSWEDASRLTNDRGLADFFDGAVVLGGEHRAKAIANWTLNELLRLLTKHDVDVKATRVTPGHLVELLDLIEQGAVSVATAKEVFEETFETGRAPSEIVRAKGLGRIADTGELEEIIVRVIGGNGKAVDDYHAGKAQAVSFLMGQVMRATRGKADPAVTERLIKQKLDSNPD